MRIRTVCVTGVMLLAGCTAGDGTPDPVGEAATTTVTDPPATTTTVAETTTTTLNERELLSAWWDVHITPFMVDLSANIESAGSLRESCTALSDATDDAYSIPAAPNTAVQDVWLDFVATATVASIGCDIAIDHMDPDLLSAAASMLGDAADTIRLLQETFDAETA